MKAPRLTEQDLQNNTVRDDLWAKAERLAEKASGERLASQLERLLGAPESFIIEFMGWE